jgi:hypothetical protein
MRGTTTTLFDPILEGAVIVKAIVTSMDNLPLLRVSVPILLADPDINEVIVVNQESHDGTAEWLATMPITAVNRKNNGAGPGRNAGLDRAGKFDYVFMLDGGMRPLLPGIRPMLDFLERRPDVDVLGLEWRTLETDIDRAWRRWPYTVITDAMTYQYSMLSLANYALCKARAWNGLRQCEEGPWGEPGWGADDDEMAYRWRVAGIVVHALMEAKAYRRGSGSFGRLFRETGIWPNQYGSTYEKRCVWLMQEWPDQMPLSQWGEPWLTVVVKGGSIESTAAIIKAAHNGLRQWHMEGKWAHVPQPYSVVLWTQDSTLLTWAEPRRLRQHHGDTTIVDGQIVRRNANTEATWAADFRVWKGNDPAGGVRDNAHFFCVVESMDDLERLLAYWERFPKEIVCVAPEARRERVLCL